MVFHIFDLPLDIQLMDFIRDYFKFPLLNLKYTHSCELWGKKVTTQITVNQSSDPITKCIKDDKVNCHSRYMSSLQWNKK